MGMFRPNGLEDNSYMKPINLTNYKVSDGVYLSFDHSSDLLINGIGRTIEEAQDDYMAKYKATNANNNL